MTHSALNATCRRSILAAKSKSNCNFQMSVILNPTYMNHFLDLPRNTFAFAFTHINFNFLCFFFFFLSLRVKLPNGDFFLVKDGSDAVDIKAYKKSMALFRAVRIHCVDCSSSFFCHRLLSLCTHSPYCRICSQC